MEIHFDGKNSIIGCKIISYLLEKVIIIMIIYFSYKFIK